MSIYEIRKNVYGVPELNSRFMKKIAEITFQQMRSLSVGVPK